MPVSPCRKGNSARGRAQVLALVLFASLVTLCVGPGCRHPQVTATVTYGPVGPVNLSATVATALVDSIVALSPAASGDHDPTAWPLEIRFSPGGSFAVVVVWPEVIVVDGGPRGMGDNARALADAVRTEFLAGLSLPDALLACEAVDLEAGDEPALHLSLSGPQREGLGRAVAGLSLRDPDSGLGGAPYPGYSVTLAWSDIPVAMNWTGREYITLWSRGVLDALSWHDPEANAWQACLTLLPPPPPEERQGLAKLFAATADVRASGGNLGQPVVSGAWKAPILVRILQEGQASADPAPPAEPITVIFADGEHEWKVYLYQDGFLFEKQYYRLDGAERTFLSTMSAG